MFLGFFRCFSNIRLNRVDFGIQIIDCIYNRRMSWFSICIFILYLIMESINIAHSSFHFI